MIGGAGDGDACGRAREADRERRNSRRHRKREDDLAREVVVRDGPRDVPEDDLVDVAGVDLCPRKRLARGAARQVEHIKLRERRSCLHERRSGSPEDHWARHPACKRSEQASSDVKTVMQTAGQFEGAYDPGVPRHLEYPAIPLGELSRHLIASHRSSFSELQ